jgi:hypothetical protein
VSTLILSCVAALSIGSAGTKETWHGRRLDAMLQAGRLVEAALDRFYGWLSNEQKALQYDEWSGGPGMMAASHPSTEAARGQERPLCMGPAREGSKLRFARRGER